MGLESQSKVMTKESIYELQKIDCNCNDCFFLVRLLDKFNEVTAKDKSLQEDIFALTKERKINKAVNDIRILTVNKHLIISASEKIKAKTEYLQELKSKNFVYQGQQIRQHYGNCNKFQKVVTFIPNICQIETQDCFIHRKDVK